MTADTAPTAPDAPTPLDLDAIRALVADLDAAFAAPDDGRTLVTEHPTLTLLSHVAAQVPALLAEVARLHAEVSARCPWNDCPHGERCVHAVVRDHQPVKPDRETLSAALHGLTREEWDACGDSLVRSALRDQVSAQVDAVLDLWPGESRAQVQAEALRDAAEESDWPYDEIACLNSWEAVTVVLGALRDRADRIEKGDTP